MEPRTIVLKNTDDIRVADLSEVIAQAMFPDGIPIYSNRWFSDEGEPLLDDTPCMMRFIEKPRIEQDIRDLFESGKLILIDPSTKIALVVSLLFISMINIELQLSVLSAR